MKPVSLRYAVYRLLDRRGTRWLLGCLASAYVSARRHRPVRISYVDGVWRHRSPGGVIFDPKITTMTFELLEELYLDVFAYGYRPTDGDVVLDIGAGVGVEALLFSRLVGEQGRVVAVEAHPAPFRCMELLLEHYGVTNATAVNVAVGDHPGEAQITSLFGHRSNALSSNGAGELTVPMTTLDALRREYEIDRVSLLKMNIEGAEVAALLSGGETLARTHHACISCHDFKAIRTGDVSFRTKTVVHDVLVGLGFDIRSRSQDRRPAVRDYLYATRHVEHEVD